MLSKFIEYSNNILFEEFTEGNKAVVKFINDRKLDESDIDRYALGYIRPDNSIPKFMNDNKEYFTQINLLNSKGITAKGRFIIPVKNIHGKYSMVACRTLKEKSDNKYLTIKDLDFDKNEIMFGYYENRSNILYANTVIVTEGQFDYISSDKNGIRNCIAISGSSLNKIHVELLNDISKNIDIVFATDNDLAGRNCIINAIYSYPELTDRMFYIEYEYGDPDEYFRNGGTAIEFLSKIKPVEEIFNFKNQNIGDRIRILQKFRKHSNISNIYYIYNFIGRLNADSQKSFFISFLDKKIKTFANVGEFIYTVYYLNLSINKFIERMYATWWMIGYDRGYKLNYKFKSQDIVDLFYGIDIKLYDVYVYNRIPTLREAYYEPIENEEGEIIGTKQCYDFTDKVFQNVCIKYLEMLREAKSE